MASNVEFVERYVECLEALPLDAQRLISQIRDLDSVHKSKLEQVGRFMLRYKHEQNGANRRKWLNKIQKCLVRSQQCGDEKLQLISQIVELSESRNQQINKDIEHIDLRGKDGILSNGSSNSGPAVRPKMEKKNPITDDRQSKSLYDKPKRMRRVRTLEKIAESVEKTHKALATAARFSPKDLDPDEKLECKAPKDVTKKDREKDKEREREKDNGEKKQDEKKLDRKEKNAKVVKKTPKQNTKVKKKKKKEKESVSEDMAIDPDELTYCLCNRVSFGDMIGCDNDDCVIEWFHFGCVNLTTKPKGKWYCPGCTAERKEKSKKT